MIVMLDNPHAPDATFVIGANFWPESLPVAFDYGKCSANYNFLRARCDPGWSTCAAGYSQSNTYGASGSCLCTCCKGQDCGCAGGQYYWCD